ncbi:MAG: hypothetical protein LUC94_00495 [Clostridiales bacterium]|nr:hypothetical protein [Clostridiales bacterium]
MRTAVTKNGKNIKIISPNEYQTNITPNDAEMDRRATQAVKAAIEKAQFCKKPIARYDKEAKKTYIEYSDGTKNYVR